MSLLFGSIFHVVLITFMCRCSSNS